MSLGAQCAGKAATGPASQRRCSPFCRRRRHIRGRARASAARRRNSITASRNRRPVSSCTSSSAGRFWPCVGRVEAAASSPPAGRGRAGWRRSGPPRRRRCPRRCAGRWRSARGREMLARLVGVVAPDAGRAFQVRCRARRRANAACRFCTWQELVAEPRSTKRSPWASMAKGCIGWSPVSGRPETIDFGRPLGGIRLPARRSARCDRSFRQRARPCKRRCRCRRRPLRDGRRRSGRRHRPAVAFGILERDQKSARRRRVVL